MPLEGAEVIIEGAAFPIDNAAPDRYLLLGPEAACCAGCRPDPAATVEALLTEPAPPGPGPIRLVGRWRSLPPDDPAG